MEILFVSHKYPPSIGGMEKQSFELINGLKQFTKVCSIVYDGTESRIKFFVSLRKRIRKVCKQHPNISLIHFNDGLMATACLHIKTPSHIKRVVTAHGLDIVFPNIIYQKFILPQFNKFDSIIAVSHATAEACIQRGIQKEKVVVIHNGVDQLISFNKQPENNEQWFLKNFDICLNNTHVLVAMGRAVERKGFSWFIKHVIPKLNGNFKFIIIGPFNKKKSWFISAIMRLPKFFRKQIELFLGYPSDEVTIKALLKKPAVKEKVIHAGKLPFDDIKRMLSSSTAFVMPNIEVKGDMEGFGLVCLEASLCEALVIASGSGGITDAIHHHKNGIVLTQQDAEVWSTQLNHLFEHPLHYAHLKAKGKNYTMQHFSWNKMATEYWNHFCNLSKSKV